MSICSVFSRILGGCAICVVLFMAVVASSASAHVGVFAGPNSFLGGDRALPAESRAIKVSPDGRNVYVLGSTQLKRFGTDGSVETLVNEEGLAGKRFDSKDAKRTQLKGRSFGFAVSPNGKSLYILEQSRVLRIGIDDGTVKVVLGASAKGAGKVRLENWMAGAVSPDGNSLYVAAGNRVWRASSDGQAAPEVFLEEKDLVGVGNAGPPGISSVAVSPDGASVYLSDAQNHRVWRMRSDGGGAPEVFIGGIGAGNDINPENARATALRFPEHIEVAPDGSVYVKDRYQNEDFSNRRVLRSNSEGTAVEMVAGPASNDDPQPWHGHRFDSLANFISSGNYIAIAPDGSLLVGKGSQILLFGANDEFEATLRKLVDTAAHVNKPEAAAKALSELKLLAVPAVVPIRQINKLARKERSQLGGIPGVYMALPHDVTRLVTNWLDAANAPGRISAQPFKRLRARLAISLLPGLRKTSSEYFERVTVARCWGGRAKREKLEGGVALQAVLERSAEFMESAAANLSQKQKTDLAVIRDHLTRQSLATNALGALSWAGHAQRHGDSERKAQLSLISSWLEEAAFAEDPNSMKTDVAKFLKSKVEGMIEVLKQCKRTAASAPPVDAPGGQGLPVRDGGAKRAREEIEGNAAKGGDEESEPQEKRASSDSPG